MNAKRGRVGWNKIIETTALDNDSCAQSAATSTVVPLFGILNTTTWSGVDTFPEEVWFHFDRGVD